MTKTLIGILILITLMATSNAINREYTYKHQNYKTKITIETNYTNQDIITIKQEIKTGESIFFKGVRYSLRISQGGYVHFNFSDNTPRGEDYKRKFKLSISRKMPFTKEFKQELAIIYALLEKYINDDLTEEEKSKQIEIDLKTVDEFCSKYFLKNYTRENIK